MSLSCYWSEMEKMFSLSASSMMRAGGFIYDLCHFENISFYSNLLSVFFFITERCWVLKNVFCISWDNPEFFFLHFCDVCYIDFSSGRPHLVLTYSLFNVLLKLLVVVFCAPLCVLYMYANVLVQRPDCPMTCVLSLLSLGRRSVTEAGARLVASEPQWPFCLTSLSLSLSQRWGCRCMHSQAKRFLKRICHQVLCNFKEFYTGIQCIFIIPKPPTSPHLSWVSPTHHPSLNFMSSFLK